MHQRFRKNADMDRAMTPGTASGVQGSPGTLDREKVEIARLDLRARKAWAVLLKRFGGDGAIADPQIDYLFARYLLGLTAALYRTAPAMDHLAVFRHLLTTAIGADRTEAALRTAPPDFPPPWTTETLASVERLGRAEGLRMQTVDFDEKEISGFRSAIAG
jgi:hypothetical protein